MIIGMIQTVCQTALLFFYLAIINLPTKGGIVTTALVMELGMIPIDVTVGVIAYRYIHKNMLKLRVPIAQIFVGIVIPAFISFSILFLIKIFVFDALFAIGGFYLAAIVTIILIAIALIMVYFPLTGILGGWDNTNLKEFKKVAMMSGPSKFVTYPIYKSVEKMCHWSRLHGRFEMPVEGVLKEATELLEIKQANRNAMVSELNLQQKN
jgi:hypothetical protein